MKYLATFEDSYGDEFEIGGWRIMDQQELDKWKAGWQVIDERLKERTAIMRQKAFEKHLARGTEENFRWYDWDGASEEVSFGGNDYLEYFSFEEVLDRIVFTEITEEEEAVLYKLFKTKIYGITGPLSKFR